MTCKQDEVAKQKEGAAGAGADDEGEVQPEPLDMSFPSGVQKQCTYILLFPIIFPLWLTLPDTRKRKGEQKFLYAIINRCLFSVCFSPTLPPLTLSTCSPPPYHIFQCP